MNEVSDPRYMQQGVQVDADMRGENNELHK